MLQSTRSAQTAAGAAMARLAYASAGLSPRLLESGDVVHISTKSNRDTGCPWTLDDLSLYLFNPKRDSPEADEAAEFEPDGATLANYRAGRKMPNLDRISLAVARLIMDGSIPEEAFQLVHVDVATHRALEPFRELLLELNHGRKPTPQQVDALTQKLVWLEQGQQDFDRLLREDQIKFRQSQNELLDELLALRAHLTGTQTQTAKNLKKNLRWISRRAKEFVEMMDSLRVASVGVTPDHCEHYDDDGRADSDFEEVTGRILDGAQALAAGNLETVTPELVDRQVKLVGRMHIDAWTSINFDVAEPVPLDRQPWRFRKPACEKASWL